MEAIKQICTKCFEEKTASKENFHINYNKFHTVCKLCRNKTRRHYHILNRDYLNVKSKQFREQNPDYYKKWITQKIYS